MPAHELFDFTHGLPAGSFEPFFLGGRRRDASELPSDREADGARFQITRDFGQFLEGSGDAKLFLRQAMAVTEEALCVFAERCEAETQVDSGAVSSEQPTPFLVIKTRPLRRKPNERFVSLTPRCVLELQHVC